MVLDVFVSNGAEYPHHVYHLLLVQDSVAVQVEDLEADCKNTRT